MSQLWLSWQPILEDAPRRARHQAQGWLNGGRNYWGVGRHTICDLPYRVFVGVFGHNRELMNSQLVVAKGCAIPDPLRPKGFALPGYRISATRGNRSSESRTHRPSILGWFLQQTSKGLRLSAAKEADSMASLFFAGI